MERPWMWLPAAFAAAGLTACAHPGRPDPAEVARFEAPTRDHCDVARQEDFQGPGQVRLQRYVDWLAGTHGTQAALAPGDVVLAVADGNPKPGLNGVVVGEIGCGGGAAPYRITLFQQALEGRQLQVAYHTVAHEFQHIVQVRRDGLACRGSDEAEIERYEREAMAAADRLAPACE